MIKVIIGFGNPDKEFQDTRHNIGFMMLDYIAKKLESEKFEMNQKLSALMANVKKNKINLILVKPQTYVNKTGDTALKVKNWLKIKPENMIFLHDDLDIDYGNFKVSFDKNSGGHRGIESVIKSLKTKKFYRLRFGLATPALKKARQQKDKKRDEFVMNFVLSKFSPREKENMNKMFKEAYSRLEQIIK